MYMRKFIRETTLSLLHYLIYIHWSDTTIFLDLFCDQGKIFMGT